jgi:lysophospholipase L1-like esterase
VTRSRRWSAGVAVVGLLLAGACALPGGEPGPATYAALGDSFSSGEGAPPYEPTPADCRRSALAWPRLLDASSSAIGPVDLRACSGAKTQFLTVPWSSRGLPPQIPDAPDSTVELVTVTIGGGDVGFGDIVEACFVGACPSPTDPAFVAKLATLESVLVSSVHPALAEAYPAATILHVGYPRLTPPPGDPVGACLWLSPADQVAAAAIVDAIDDTIEAAAGQSAEVAYVDVTDAFADHELCTSSPWVVPLLSPLSRAHPNAAGQRALAEAVAAAL